MESPLLRRKTLLSIEPTHQAAAVLVPHVALPYAVDKGVVKIDNKLEEASTAR